MDYWDKDGVVKFHSPDRTGWVLVEFGKHPESGLENATVSSKSTPGFYHTFPAFSATEYIASCPGVGSIQGDGSSDDQDGPDLQISRPA